MPYILLYAGYQSEVWSQDSFLDSGLNASARCLLDLAQELSKHYTVYVCSDFSINKDVEGIKYRDIPKTINELRDKSVKCLIALNYVNYLFEFKHINFEKSFFWMHHRNQFAWYRRKRLPDNGENMFYDSRMTKIICSSNWHKNYIVEKFPAIKSKVLKINNGIRTARFKAPKFKLKDSLIYASDPKRGLRKIAENWDWVKSQLEKPILHICCPQGIKVSELDLQVYLKNIDSYKFYDHLNQNDFQELLSSMEYWYYPTEYTETFCQLSLESLGYQVTPITSGKAGLSESLGQFNCKNFFERNDYAATKSYINSFDWHLQSEKWLDLIET